MRSRRYFFAFVHICLFVSPQGKLDPVREVFDAFLGLYPYCYGYWKKYADLERKHSGNDTARQVGNAPSINLFGSLVPSPEDKATSTTHMHTYTSTHTLLYTCNILQLHCCRRADILAQS